MGYVASIARTVFSFKCIESENFVYWLNVLEWRERAIFFMQKFEDKIFDGRAERNERQSCGKLPNFFSILRK